VLELNARVLGDIRKAKSRRSWSST
jgi:hypothetical protein